jgi:hypothetical protein
MNIVQIIHSEESMEMLIRQTRSSHHYPKATIEYIKELQSRLVKPLCDYTYEELFEEMVRRQRLRK